MCPKLQVIILQEAQLTDKGFAAMVKGLKRCPHFRDLIVNKNLIGDEGFSALVDVFLDGGFQVVERLDVSGEQFLKHQITDASFIRFAKALAEGEIKLLATAESKSESDAVQLEGRQELQAMLKHCCEDEVHHQQEARERAALGPLPWFEAVDTSWRAAVFWGSALAAGLAKRV